MSPQGSELRVLVADDEPAITTLIAHVLEHSGFEVVRAHGGMEAVRLCRADPPDLILLDVMMPDLDGRDACRVLKMDEAVRHVAVVLFSSADECDVPWRAAGADAFLQKPFDVRTLSALVRDRIAPAS